MKRRCVIGTTLVLLAVLVGGILRHQGVFSPARSAVSHAPADAPAIQAEAPGSDGNTSTASIKPTDAQTMQYLQTLLETWKSKNTQEPTLRQP